MSIVINRPGRSDIPEVHTLFETTLTHTFQVEGISQSLSGDLGDEIASLKQTLARDFESGGGVEHFLVARYDNRIVGTAAHGSSGKFMRANLDLNFDRTPEIKCVYIHPEFQGQGIGTRLFRAVVDKLRRDGVDAFCLDSGFTGGQRYWTNLLGPPTAVLRDHWGPGAHHSFWYRRIAEL